MSAAKVGIDNYLSTTRGAALLGAGACVLRCHNTLNVGVDQGEEVSVNFKLDFIIELT